MHYTFVYIDTSSYFKHRSYYICFSTDNLNVLGAYFTKRRILRNIISKLLISRIGNQNSFKLISKKLMSTLHISYMKEKEKMDKNETKS